MSKELSTRTGFGSCKACGERKPKICKKVYPDGSMHFVDDKDKSWNSSTCPSCYVARRKIKRKVAKPETVSCVECSLVFKPKLSKQKFCSDGCRKKHHNDKRVLVEVPSPSETLVNPEDTQTLMSKLEKGYSDESFLEQAKKVMETHAAVFKKLKESGD